MVKDDLKTAYLRHTLPYGIISDDEYTSSNPRHAAIAACLQKELLKDGLLERITIPAKERMAYDVERLQLTPTGIAAALDAQEIFSSISETPPIRGKLDDSAYLRRARAADITRFFEASGIETARTAIAKGCNPYILGYPEYTTTTPVLHQVVTAANVAWVQTHNYPDYTAKQGPALFLSKYDLPPYHPYYSSRDPNNLHFYNDCSGILIDFKHTATYYIFHNYCGANSRWHAAAYNSFCARFSDSLKRIYNNNASWITEPVYPVKSSIILTHSDAELCSLWHLVPKVSAPFSSVFGLSMDTAGAYYLSALLEHGVRSFQAWQNNWLLQNDAAYDLDKHGNLLFDDEPAIACGVIDYKRLYYDVYLRCKMRGTMPYVVCPPWYEPLVLAVMRQGFRDQKYKRERPSKAELRNQIVPIPTMPPGAYPLIPDEHYNHPYICWDLRFWRNFYT